MDDTFLVISGWKAYCLTIEGDIGYFIQNDHICFNKKEELPSCSDYPITKGISEGFLRAVEFDEVPKLIMDKVWHYIHKG